MQGLSRFLVSAVLYYVCTMYAGHVFALPDQIIRFSSFLPPLLGLMWGPVAAVGILCGELVAEAASWQALLQMHREGTDDFVWQALLLVCNCGLWTFFAAYLPCRLWHSILVKPKEPLFSLRTGILLKYVWIIFLTTAMTSIFLALTTDETDMAQQLGNSTIRYGKLFEYAFLCFINDFNISIFFGLICFFVLISYDYPFYKPRPSASVGSCQGHQFDLVFLFACGAGLYLCQSQMAGHEGIRLAAGLLLCSYALRPLSPHLDSMERQKNAKRTKVFHMNSIVAAIFYAFFLLLFLLLDISGTIYDLADMDTWRQFNAECLTMMNAALVSILYMLLRYSRSIMANVVLLEVMTVFISASVLGGMCFVMVDRITSQHLEETLENMSTISRERIKRIFDGIQVSVNDIRDLALDELESYDRLTGDADYRRAYLSKTEYLFNSIASNTAGSIAFYLRLAPEFSGPLGGFSWGRDPNRWEGAATKFHRRTPVDLSKYDPSDTENVGWYYIPVERHQATWIEPYLDPAVRGYVVSYVSPLYADGNLVGVAGMDIDFDYIIHELRRMSVSMHGYAYLTGRNGKVLYHKDYPQGEQFEPNRAFHEKEVYLTNGIWLGIAMPMREVYAERNNLLMHIVSLMLLVAILVSLLSISLAAKGIRPLLSLTEAAKKVAAGILDVELPRASDNELGILVKSIGEMVSKLEIYVYRDSLTGLKNTAAYMRQCNELDEHRKDPGFHYAIVVFDVNFLKKVNDQYGHEAGNDLIRSASRAICHTFAHSPVFRIGGDEFTAILQRHDYEHREELLETFDKAVAAERIQVEGKELGISVARGIGMYEEGMDYAAVFQQADDAMYAHKSAIKKKFGEEVR